MKQAKIVSYEPLFYQNLLKKHSSPSERVNVRSSAKTCDGPKWEISPNISNDKNKQRRTKTAEIQSLSKQKAKASYNTPR